MPSIEFLGQVQPPPKDTTWDRQTFPSPDGKWVIIYHDPVEWRMAHDGWKISLLHEGKDVTNEHSEVLTLAGGTGFRCPHDFKPWCFDSETLTILTWSENRPVFFYKVSSRQKSAIKIFGQPPIAPWWNPLARLSPRQVHQKPPATAQWAPDRDRLLLDYSDRAVLIDSYATQRGVAKWQMKEYTSPWDVFWLRPADFFVLVGRRFPREKVQISFFNGDDGAFVEAFDADPADLFPFNKELYSSISRTQATLVLSRYSSNWGFLLDEWHGIRFDPDSGLLLLAIYRPLGPPYEEQPYGVVCQVQEHWFGIRLTV